ncbi:ATP-grasp domain-containing protein [Bernardetia sp. Wsw4-3y2]|uniref:ATP-grasp domain-containing protein n=1 Tax=Bernardetia sp. Wsw4-3y2 TaxID=3127471 RepID=UPI0030CDF114
MKIIYCDSIINPQVIDADYETEQKAAKNAGFETHLLSFEKLEEGNINSAIHFISKKEEKEMALYRGWMVQSKTYELLYNALLQKNIQLINSPKEYEHCHYLPNSYSKIENHTPISNWMKLNDVIDFEEIYKLTNQFGENSIIIKDYVKSEKYHWKEACFIPKASDKDKIKNSVQKFIQLRGKQLNEGLVFRKFEELEFLTQHSKSSLPLTKEFRIFFLNKKIVNIFNYWDEGEYGDTKPDLKKFTQIAQEIDSNFFTMDIAQKIDGEWIIMELGDGQVSGLPDNADKNDFYKNLKKMIY